MKDAEALADARAEKEAADLLARQRAKKWATAVQVQEQMQSGQIFAEDNLSVRFPSATQREIETALEQADGHAGKACKILRQQHEDMGAASPYDRGDQHSRSSSSVCKSTVVSSNDQEQGLTMISSLVTETPAMVDSTQTVESEMEKRTRLRKEALEREKRRRQSAKAIDGPEALRRAQGGGTVGGAAAGASALAIEEERARLRQEALSREKARRAALWQQTDRSSARAQQLSVDEMAARLRAARSNITGSNSGTRARPTTTVPAPSSTSSEERLSPSSRRGVSSVGQAAGTTTLRHQQGVQQPSSPQWTQLSQPRVAAPVRRSKGALSEAVPPDSGSSGRKFKRMAPVPKQRGAGRKQPKQ